MGQGGGIPTKFGKYTLYATCIFINTKTYAKNDIIVLRNSDYGQWNNVDIDLGTYFVYVCTKSLITVDVFPNKSEATPPPQGLATFDASNENWKQISPTQLESLMQRNEILYVIVLLVVVVIFFIMYTKNYTIQFIKKI